MESGEDLIMSMKIIGVVLIIASCGMFGFMRGFNLKREIRALHDLIGILNYMECELSFKLTPLPQLCRNCVGFGQSLDNLFLTLADELESQIAPDVSTCMNASIAKCGCQSALLMSFLTELGHSFGKFDLQGQLTGIKTVRQSCAKQLEVLECGKVLRIRNYQTLGICAGAALAIILL